MSASEELGAGRSEVDALTRLMGGPSREVISIGLALQRTRGAFAALDLGSGAGRHSVYLASLGATVTAVEASPVFANTLSHLSEAAGLPVDVVCGRIEHFAPRSEYDLVVCHGILHFVEADSARDIISRLKASTCPGGVHVITLSLRDPERELPASFVRQGYRGDVDADFVLAAYHDWICCAVEEYTKRDHHPGEGYHFHRIAKLVLQRPAATIPLLATSAHRLDAYPERPVAEFLFADSLTQTTKEQVIAAVGLPDRQFVYDASGFQLSFHGARVDHRLELWFWSRTVAYFEEGILVGHGEYGSSVFHTFA